LVSRRESGSGSYIRTNSQGENFISGESLADAFNNSIRFEIKELFLNCIDEGVVSERQLQALLPDFNLMVIPSGSPEQELLTRLLIQKDFPLRIEEDSKIYRSTTVRNLLEYIDSTDEEYHPRGFIYNCYDNKGKVNNAENDTIMGWYYY